MRTARGARFFQITPIKMKRAISVREATLMMATVRNTSVADGGFMSCLAYCGAPKLTLRGWKCFGSGCGRREMRTVRASGAA